MAALTRDKNRKALGADYQITPPIPVAAAAVIYKGALVALNANGFAAPAGDTASFLVAGIAREKVDNSAGANGDKSVVCEYGRHYLFTAVSIAQAMLGDPMYVVDDDTIDDAAGTTNDVFVGRLTKFESASAGYVYVPGLSTYLP
jgi:hypothetical protein